MSVNNIRTSKPAVFTKQNVKTIAKNSVLSGAICGAMTFAINRGKDPTHALKSAGIMAGLSILIDVARVLIKSASQKKKLSADDAKCGKVFCHQG